MYKTYYTYTVETGGEDDYSAPKRSLTSHVVYGDTEAWKCVLKDFTSFLSAHYGYNITESVLIKLKDGSTLELTDVYDFE